MHLKRLKNNNIEVKSLIIYHCFMQNSDKDPNWEAGDDILPQVATHFFASVSGVLATAGSLYSGNSTIASLTAVASVYFIGRYNKANTEYRNRIYGNTPE
tara:strand:+ start:228 stop:527 length:300 start_codon:yes stop_codon:yes gene_type:complete